MGELRDELSLSKFKGLSAKYPLHRDRQDKTLWFVVEHEPNHSRAGYEVVSGKRSKSFAHLEDAVAYFNGRRPRHDSDNA